MESAQKVQSWYNAFAQKQMATGTNLRHYKLINVLIRSGLKKNHTVLEVGCGIGTLTRLIYKYLTRGKMVAVDISDESIAIAKSRIKGKRIDFAVTDMSSFSYPEKFDFIVLPDVLEHIPVDQHKNLFRVISGHMHENSILVINIPHPRALDYLRVHSPEKLQVIDQSLRADELLNNTYVNDLELIAYHSYPLYNKENDYVLIKFRKNRETDLNPLSKPEIIIRKLFQRIKFLAARLV